MADAKWVMGSYMEARKSGLCEVRGYLYRGLGVRMIHPRASLQGYPTARWCLTHVNTAHSVAFINAEADRAMEIATAVAEAGDWSFSGLKGYENMDPNLIARCVALGEWFAPALDLGDEENESREDLARECASKLA
jgi:hypothetical protein